MFIAGERAKCYRTVVENRDRSIGLKTWVISSQCVAKSMRATPLSWRYATQVFPSKSTVVRILYRSQTFGSRPCTGASFWKPGTLGKRSWLREERRSYRSTDFLLMHHQATATHERATSAHEQATAAHERATSAHEQATATHERATSTHDRATSTHERATATAHN